MLFGIHQDDFAVFQGSNDKGLAASNGRAIAGVERRAISVDLSGGRNKIGMTSLNGVIGQAFARLRRGAQDDGVSTDFQRTFIGPEVAGQSHALSRSLSLGKRFRAPLLPP